MILYFKDKFKTIFAVDSSIELNEIDLKKLEWLFVAKHINQSSINSIFNCRIIDTSKSIVNFPYDGIGYIRVDAKP